MSNKSIRVRTNLSSDSSVYVDMEQNFETLEILSLKISKSDTLYKLHTSNYGCIVGRAIANGGFGVPNAKISVFIPKDFNLEDDSIINELYSYTDTNTIKNNDIRYNLLPEEGTDICYQPVGTFPLKRMVLDDVNMIEVYEKYYRYTTRTNNSGDYMIFGVPVGNQKVHCDVDISDCGVLSQKPRDLLYKGYNETQFESPNKFRGGKDINSLPQIFTEEETVDVIPFWGEKDENVSNIGITRKDINISYKFEPTCIFIGSVFSDSNDNGFSKSCIPNDNMGEMSTLETKNGTIEMIRKTMDGGIEEFQISATDLIDSDGTWCYQIPMNLDYVTTDEYGKMVPTDDKEKGIPTRTSVRFRISMNSLETDYGENHYTKVLVPHNPKTEEEIDYVFGNATKDCSFRDMFWNNVYTVKGYIPRIQTGHRDGEKRHSGIKGINFETNKNPIPYNNMEVNVGWDFSFFCAIFKSITRFAIFFNRLGLDRLFTIGDGFCPSLKGWYFCPNCNSKEMKRTLGYLKEKKREDYDEKSNEYTNADDEENICVTNNLNYFIQCQAYAMISRNRMVDFQFYNDWINGALYIPRWFAEEKKKATFKIGKSLVKTTINACLEKNFNDWRQIVVQCALNYGYNVQSKTFTTMSSPLGCDSETKQRCHRMGGRKYIPVLNYKGGIHDHTTYQGEHVYYFKPCEWVSETGRDTLRRCILFSTDIVLLGSLNENDNNGVSNIFSKYPSTTYRLPQTLAQTNMGVSGPMLGYDADNFLCNDTTEEGVTKIEDTFENYKRWSSKQDFADNEDYTKSYAITEASGILWDYSGPNQGEKDREKGYFPGGHFLGSDCTNPEVNIKSCTNLYRACELGVGLSSRKRLVIDNRETLDTVTPDYAYAYVIPTGLISRNDIFDQGVRSAFASMNFYNLKTERDYVTLRPTYKHRNVWIDNFNGEMSKYVESNNIYNGYAGYDDSSKVAEEETLAYRNTDETVSRDYYYFRMGVEPETNNIMNALEERYLIKNNDGSVSLPMYENSFYFYFGINKGRTAIDKFLSKFEASCPDVNAYVARYTISGSGVDFCDESSTTEWEVNIYDMEGPYIIYLYEDEVLKRLSVNEDGNIVIDENGNEFAQTNLAYFKIGNLKKGDYTIVLGGMNESSIEQQFTVGVSYPSGTEEIKAHISGRDFEDAAEKYYPDADIFNSTEEPEDGVLREDIGGYINLVKPELYGSKFKGYVIKSPSYFKCSSESIYDKVKNMDEFKALKNLQFNDLQLGDENYYNPTVWEGNTYFKIYLVYDCSEDESDVKLIFLDTILISIEVCDTYFTNTNVTLKKLYYLWGDKKFIDENINILKDILKSNGYKEDKKIINNETIWYIKKALFFDKSLYDTSKMSEQHFGLIGKSKIARLDPLYLDKLLYNDENNPYFTVKENFFSSDMRNYTNCYFPSETYIPLAHFNVPIEGNYYPAITNAEGEENNYIFPNKKDIGCKIVTKEEKLGSSNIPIIYRPFYFHMGIVQYKDADNGYVTSYGATIANGISFNNESTKDYKYSEVSLFYGDKENITKKIILTDNFIKFGCVVSDEPDYIGDIKAYKNKDKDVNNGFGYYYKEYGVPDTQIPYVSEEELFSNATCKINLSSGRKSTMTPINDAMPNTLNIKFRVTEYYDKDYNFSPTVIEKGIKRTFISEDNLVSNDDIVYLKITDRRITPWDIFDGNSVHFNINYKNFYMPPQEGQTSAYLLPQEWKGIFTLYYNSTPAKETNNVSLFSDMYFKDDLINLKDNDINDCFFIGLFDNWTEQLTKEELKETFKNRDNYKVYGLNEIMHKYTPKHTPNISLIRIYTPTEMANIVEKLKNNG